MRTGLELLETGELHVRRHDAAELIAVRNGALSFEALEALTEDYEKRMRAAAANASLPEDVDPEFVDALALELIRGSDVPL
jgi:hypothetical protein